MHILITGASGFIGVHLTAALLEAGTLAGSPVDRIVAVDPAPPSPAFAGDSRVCGIQADATDPGTLGALFGTAVDTVFALGATLTSDAEARFDEGYAVNLHGMLRLLDACRAQERTPRVVYTSSIAAFGGPLPDTVDDDLHHAPQTSYGTQKAINELLIDDYSRHGFIDGRCLRLPVVLVRPGAPGPSAGSISDRLAALVREPLEGRDVVCPWRADTRVPVASVRSVVRALIAVHDAPVSAFRHTRTLNLPAASTRIDEIVTAVEAIAVRTNGRAGRVEWRPDAALQAIVDGWPQRFVSSRAAALGVVGDDTIDAIVQSYVDDVLEPAAIRAR